MEAGVAAALVKSCVGVVESRGVRPFADAEKVARGLEGASSAVGWGGWFMEGMGGARSSAVLVLMYSMDGAERVGSSADRV